MCAWVRLPRRMNLHLTMVSLHLVDGKSVGCAKPYGGKKRIICVIYRGIAQLVARDIWDVEAGSSSLPTPTILTKRYRCVWRKARRIKA